MVLKYYGQYVDVDHLNLLGDFTFHFGRDTDKIFTIFDITRKSIY